jgi:hypothetical protein
MVTGGQVIFNPQGPTREQGQPRSDRSPARSVIRPARDPLAELLPIRERILGPEHPNTLATRRSLASWTGEAGESRRAWELFGELLPIHERVLGVEHPDTMWMRRDLKKWGGLVEGEGEGEGGEGEGGAGGVFRVADLNGFGGGAG